MSNNTFSLNTKPLRNILSSMQPICTKRTTIDATSCVLFHVSKKELILKSTDLEVSLQASCTLDESELEEGTTFLAPGKRVFDVIKELDDTVTCHLESNQLRLETDTLNLSLNTKDANEFPPFPESIENMMQMGAHDMLTMIDSVAFLIPKNNTNPALNGVYIEIDDSGMKMTATDGHCLAQTTSSQYTLEEPQQWLVPRRAIFELKKIIESSEEQTIFLGMCGNHLVFSGQDFNFFTKLLNETFPAYQHILDTEGFTPAHIDRNSFTKTLRRATCLLSGQFIATQFSFKPAQLDVAMHNKEVGSLHETIELQSYGDDSMDIWFYAPYIINGLHVFDENNVTCYVKDMVKPIIFSSRRNDVDVTYLVMPVSQPNG